MKFVGVWWEMQTGKSTWNYSDYADSTDANGQLIPNHKHGANTENVKRYIDFASTNGIKGVLVEGHRPKMTIAVDHLVCTDTKLIINTEKPGKMPLLFDIGDLRIKDIGPEQPLRFDARLVNPKPVGDIHSTGQFGPLNDTNPRDSNVSGEYSFTNADLGTIKGIGGILSSTGKYQGTLGRIVADGTTETPDFRLTISGHPVPLHTEFHAIIDGTDGDTYLQPVKARVLSSSFTAQGKVVRVDNQHGRDIELDVVLDRARIEDLLQLGVKTDPPIMSGVIKMKASLSIPPGEPSVSDRMKLKGRFQIPAAQFSSDKIQSRINALESAQQRKAATRQRSL